MQHGPVSSEPVVRSRRGRSTALDMVRSLGLMFVVILVLLLITPARTLIFPGGDGNSAAAVSDGEQLSEWQHLTGRAALLPPVPAGWRINAATMSGTSPDRAHLHIGWVTPAQQYVGVDEGFGRPRKVLAAAIGPGSRAAPVTVIAGRHWTTRIDVHGDAAYLLSTGRFSVVVTGTLTPAGLQRLAASLAPARA